MTIESDDFGVGRHITIENSEVEPYPADTVDELMARKANRTVIEELDSRLRAAEVRITELASLLGVT